MSSMPVGDRTEQSYRTPTNTQFSVFLDNRVGKLLELVEVFDGQNLRLVAMSVVDSTDYAVVRLVTSNAARARVLLSKHHLPFSETEILVVEFAHSQTLAKLCLALLSAEVNIHYAYPLMVRPHGAATIALHTDELTLSGDILVKKGFLLLAESDLCD